MEHEAENVITGFEKIGAQEMAYRPIQDYALIGDCHGAALTASDGSVDWCCLARFDAEPVLWRLLDAEQGGFFQVRPKVTMTSSGPTFLKQIFCARRSSPARIALPSPTSCPSGENLA